MAKSNTARDLDYNHAYREIARLNAEISRLNLVLEDRERANAMLEARVVDLRAALARARIA